MVTLTWPEVVLAAINVLQVVALTYIAKEQVRSSEERERRRLVDVAGAPYYDRPPPRTAPPTD